MNQLTCDITVPLLYCGFINYSGGTDRCHWLLPEIFMCPFCQAEHTNYEEGLVLERGEKAPASSGKIKATNGEGTN